MTAFGATGKSSETMPPIAKVSTMLSAAKKNMLPTSTRRTRRKIAVQARPATRASTASGITTKRVRGRSAPRLFADGMNMIAAMPAATESQTMIHLTTESSTGTPL